MIKHVLLIAVLEEMQRLEGQLATLFETRPPDWQEIYTAVRRQIKLCLTEMVQLAQDDLEMSAEDAQHLQQIFEECRSRIETHQERWPVASIDLKDPLCLQSFQAVKKASTEFQGMMRDLVERYRTTPDKVP